MSRQLSLLIACCIYLSTLASVVHAAVPSESLLPNTTKGYVSIPDIEGAREKWDETQFGQLMNDEAMKPFMEDFRGQVKKKLNNTEGRLAIALDDLDGVVGGEISIALIQPKNDNSQHALAVIIDVTENLDKAQDLLDKISKNLIDDGGKKSSVKIGDIEVIKFTMPKTKDRRKVIQGFYVIHKDHLIAVDHEETLRGIIGRFSGKAKDTLANDPAYAAAMKRCKDAAGDIAPHIRWFVEPFGTVEVIRAQRNQKTRGKDFLKAFTKTGFREAIKGAGGYIVFATGEQEVLHYSFIAGGEQKKAAKVLNFPNSDDLVAQSWIQRNGALFFSFNWEMTEAFDAIKWLVDELAGDEIFDEVVKSIKLDPAGPQIDLRSEFVHQFANRATFVSDYRLPVTPESERFMVAIKLRNSNIVQRTVNQAMEHDTQAIKREFAGHVIWEIVNDDEGDDGIAGPVIDGPPGLIPLGNDPDEDEELGALPNSAVCVARDHLIISSHVDYIRDMLTDISEVDTLAEAADYQMVNNALTKLGAGSDSYRIFGRMDEAYRPTYELIRQGKMPESKTIFGKVLNRFLGPEEEDVARKQQIDGTKLPDYQVVRRYFGPTGMYVKTEDSGWFVTGCLLSKDMQ